MFMKQILHNMQIRVVIDKLEELVVQKKIEIKAHNDRMWVVMKINKWFKANMH